MTPELILILIVLFLLILAIIQVKIPNRKQELLQNNLRKAKEVSKKQDELYNEHERIQSVILNKNQSKPTQSNSYSTMTYDLDDDTSKSILGAPCSFIGKVGDFNGCGSSSDWSNVPSYITSSEPNSLDKEG